MPRMMPIAYPTSTHSPLMALQCGRHALLALLLGAAIASCAASESGYHTDPSSPALASGHGHGQGSAVDALAFMVVTLLIGVFTLHLLAPVTHLPYTALLLARTPHCPSHAWLRAALLCSAALAQCTCPAPATPSAALGASVRCAWCGAAGVGRDTGHRQQVLLLGLDPARQRHAAVGGDRTMQAVKAGCLTGNCRMMFSSHQDHWPSLVHAKACAVHAQTIDPNLLLTAFLPILLFAGAFALEWHTMRRLMWSSLLLAGAAPRPQSMSPALLFLQMHVLRAEAHCRSLIVCQGACMHGLCGQQCTKYRAGPGVLVGTILTALLVKYTFPYGWTWVESLLFGAMFSATDPVAVIAVLKEVRSCLLACSLV